MILQSNHLAVGYSQTLVKNIDFSVEKPSLIGVVGSNGAGKSTLLKTLCGLLLPLSGSVILNGKNTELLSIKEIATQITYLPGSKTFHPNLTVKELLLLATMNTAFSFYKIPALNEVQQNALERLGIVHLAEKPLGKLSDGQYQLASVAFALCRNTSVILFDEPLAFLDFHNRKLLLRYFSQLVSSFGKTILFSSHDLYVLHHCDKIWQIEDGAFSEIEKNAIADFVEHLSK